MMEVQKISIISRLLIPLSVLFLVGCLGSDGGSDSTATAGGGGAPAVPPTTCSSVTYNAPSGAANNIVFTFDQPYLCGQFANGDWWVAQGAGGTVTITSITPNPSTRSDLVSAGPPAVYANHATNGFQVDPVSTTQQAFDEGASVTYNSALMPSLPLTLAGISSVVKAVSVPVTGLPDLQFAAVLTIVTTPVANSTTVFRPGYFGVGTKTFYPVPTLATVTAAKVGTYTPVGVPSAASFSISSIATRYRHVQLDHNTGWAGRDMHPIDNMRDYGAEIATDNGVYLLRMLLSDFNYADTTHKQALINYLQMAIDLKSIAAAGGSWDADGGHGNGRKLPLQFAHMIFGGTDFSNAITASAFSEDQQVYRSGVTGEVLWGKSGTESDYWRTTRGALGELAAGGSKDIRDYYGRIDGGGYQVGVSSEYQVCCTSQPWKYTVLALYMLGLESPPASLPLPATNNLVEYVERWVNYGVKSDDKIISINLTTSAITSDLHSNPAGLNLLACTRPPVPSAAVYGTNYGPNGAGGCITTAWAPTATVNNWIAKDNTSADAGGYGNTFGDELWAWYR